MWSLSNGRGLRSGVRRQEGPPATSRPERSSVQPVSTADTFSLLTFSGRIKAARMCKTDAFLPEQEERLRGQSSQGAAGLMWQTSHKVVPLRHVLFSTRTAPERLQPSLYRTGVLSDPRSAADFRALDETDERSARPSSLVFEGGDGLNRGGRVRRVCQGTGPAPRWGSVYLG